MHWHGLIQTNNFWMDGAAYVNQCPIPAHHDFTYVFQAEQSGTFWYHSHNALQRQDKGDRKLFQKLSTKKLLWKL